MRQVVAVSWTMPPIVLPRSIQVSRTMNALAARGWDTHVVMAPHDSNNPSVPRDDALAALYANACKLKIVEFREEREPSNWVRRQLRRWKPPANLDDANWIERCARQALKLLHRQEGVFVSFAQPWIDHLVGLEVKRISPSTPWVAHFSDPWTDSPYYDPADPRLELWREQERAVIEKADAVVFVTAETADLVMAKYPGDWRAKVHIVPHGFDCETLGPVLAKPATGTDQARGPLRMVYTGNIYEGRREPLPLFDALAELKREGALQDRFQLDIYGNSPAATADYAHERGLDDLVRFHRPVGYLESLSLIVAADSLLLLDATSEVNVFLPSKIVDYLMAGKTIFGLTPPVGASATVLRQTGHLVVDLDDREAIRQAVLSAIDLHERGLPGSTIDHEAVSMFDIRQTTERFENALLAARAKRNRA